MQTLTLIQRLMASAEEQKVYGYEPLPERSRTRVMKPKPGQFSGDFQCSIELIDLDSKHVPYVATFYH